MNLSMEISAAFETDLLSQPQNRVVQHMAKMQEPAALMLDDDGVIRECNSVVELLFGYRQDDLVSHHVSTILPQLSGMMLIRNGEVDPHFEFLCHCGHIFLAKNRQGEEFNGELSLVQLEHGGRRILRLMVRPVARTV